MDQRRLKLFFLSVLWRATVSTHPLFARCEIGPHTSAIKDALEREDAGSPDWYSVTLLTFPETMSTFPAFRNRLEGVNYCKLYLGAYIAYVKVDKRPTPVSFDSFVLGALRSLVVPVRDPTNSLEVRMLREVAKQNPGVFEWWDRELDGK